MLYRKAINWPLGDDDDPHAIAVSFVRETAHGDLFRGDDRDGEIVDVRISDARLNQRLEDLAATKQLGEPSPLSYPSPARAELFGEIFAAAESVDAHETFASRALEPFEPRANVWTIADEELAGAVDRGEVSLENDGGGPLDLGLE